VSSSLFGIHADFLRAAESGFSSIKEPLELVLSVCRDSEKPKEETPSEFAAAVRLL
jgi:hypothetical protein